MVAEVSPRTETNTLITACTCTVPLTQRSQTPARHVGTSQRTPRKPYTARPCGHGRANPILRARVATSFATHDRASAGARTDTVIRSCVHAKEMTSPMDDMRSSGHTMGPCAYPHASRLRAPQMRSVCGGGFFISSIIPRYPRRKLKSRGSSIHNENGAPEPPPATLRLHATMTTRACARLLEDTRSRK